MTKLVIILNKALLLFFLKFLMKNYVSGVSNTGWKIISYSFHSTAMVMIQAHNTAKEFSQVSPSPSYKVRHLRNDFLFSLFGLNTSKQIYYSLKITHQIYGLDLSHIMVTSECPFCQHMMRCCFNLISNPSLYIMFLTPTITNLYCCNQFSSQ